MSSSEVVSDLLLRSGSRLWSYYVRGSSSSGSSVCSCLSCPTSFPSGERQRRPSVLNEGISVTDHYKFGEVLGEGTFSVVYLAESKLEPGGWAAIKVMEKSSLQAEELSWLIDKEVQILSTLDHPHIVHLNEVFDEDDTVCFVMELAKGGEVFDRLVEHGSFDEAVTASVIVQLLCAVDYIHKQGIIHRDLKLENILYYDDSEESKIMVADFGLSEWIWETPEDAPICGTPGYMAPEVLAEKKVSTANDVWSIGVIAYILLAGYPPFFPQGMESEDEEGNNDSALIDLIMKGKYEFHPHSWSNVSDAAKDFIRKLMCVDANKRLTCEEALKHPWLSERQVKEQPNIMSMDARSVGTGFGFLLALLVLAYSYFGLVYYFFNIGVTVT